MTRKRATKAKAAAPAPTTTEAPAPASPSLGFAAPCLTISEDVRAFIDSVIETTQCDEHKTHLVKHIRKGVEQIENFMMQNHADATGAAFPSFEAMVERDSEQWKQHVDHATQDKEMNAQQRMLQPSLQLNMCAYDLKVGRPGRPDDMVYQKSDYARKYMPRGNFVAQWTSPQTDKALFFPLVRAYRKFTGQEDDGEEKAVVGEEVLSKFFTKPIQQSKYVISTTKENGEAAHLAVLKRSDGQYLFVVGSKNTHMVVTSLEDIENAIAAGMRSNGSPYQAAGPIARALLKTIARLDEKKRTFLCEFLAQTRLTASFEMLVPGYQHVQLLDFIDEDTPVFYGLSFPSIDAVVEGAEICVNPVLAYELMHSLGIRTVQFKVVPYTRDVMDQTLQEIRSAYQHEGAVNLFLDETACVIGMQKYKTVWYVCLRAIREKAKSFLNRATPKKLPTTGDTSPSGIALSALNDSVKSLTKRFKAIQVYLALTDDECTAYLALGVSFVTYLHDECLEQCGNDAEAKKLLKERVATLFPVAWKEFLERTHLNDKII